MPYKFVEDERTWKRRRYRRQRAERLATGRCTRCGRRPPEPERTLCAECGEKRRKADRARYAAARDAGLPYGGRPDAEARRKNARARSKRRYRDRCDAGACTKCGRRPPAEGRSRCEPCLGKRNAAERDRWMHRCADGLCGKCGAPAGGGARCAICAAAQSYNAEMKNSAARRRYARRKARSECTDCGAYSAGASRCVPCARRSFVRSGEHRGLPMAPSIFRVVVVETGEDLGSWQTPAELRACLAFSRLSPEDVEIVGDLPIMNAITAWT